jgi:hypothetical protein
MRKTIKITVPTADFADFNPGHGTGTVRQERQDIRRIYGATARSRITEEGVELTITGDADAIAEIKRHR